MNFLITGSAGFIGFHITNNILKKYKKSKIIGLDNLNNYYSVSLKKKRLKVLQKYKNFKFFKTDLTEKKKIIKLIRKNNINVVIHMAAQAGVRDSLKIPFSYFQSNFVGFLSVLEASHICKVKKFIFASSSSVYGDKNKYPIKEIENISPKNIYSASKKINEDVAKDFSRISNMKIIALRFFTIYGEYGRPDMLIFKFLKASFLNKKFLLFNYGKHERDYTHIEDAVLMINKLIKKKVNDKFQIFNVCSNNPVDISKLLNVITKYTKIKTKIQKVGKNEIEVFKTHGDNLKIKKYLKLNKFKNIFYEIEKIVNWYKKEKIWKLK